MRKYAVHGLLALAIILNALLPSFAVHHAEHAGESALPSIFGQRILICTGDGFTWMKLADLQSGKKKSPPPSGKCPLCYAVMHGLNAVVPGTATPVPGGFTLPPVAVGYHSFLLSSGSASPLRVRAPPVSLAG